MCVCVCVQILCSQVIKQDRNLTAPMVKKDKGRMRENLAIARNQTPDHWLNPLVPELFGRARKNLIVDRGIEYYRFIFLTRCWLGNPIATIYH